MIPAQPYNLSSFISPYSSGHEILEGLSVRYYLSWEDAMWDIIAKKKLPIGSVALVPSFWCGDVVQNMHAHGVECVHYPADQNFQTEEHVLLDFIRAHKPTIVIIFHAIGIRNILLNENIAWIRSLPKETILVEDSVHSILNPKKVSVLRDNHFIIDSWRKVVPLQGAAIYGRKIDIFWDAPKAMKSFSNKALVVIFWIFLQVLLFLQSKSEGQISRLFGRLAERVMILGYDFIGDSKEAGGVFDIFVKLHRRLDVEKIKKIKQEQVTQYEKILKTVLDRSKSVELVNYQNTDRGELRGFPLRLSLDFADSILSNLRNNGLFVRFELDDSPWSEKYKVIFLPLGPHLKSSDIEKVAEMAKSAIELCR